MWSEELQKMTIKHFGEAGATMLKAVIKGKYTFALGFDRNLFITDKAKALIPDSEKDKRYFIFSMDDSKKPASFIKAYDFIEDIVADGWAID